MQYDDDNTIDEKANPRLAPCGQPGRQQRIQLRKEAVASVVNFRAVQNFHPVWIASAAVPKITGLMKRHMK